MKKLSKIFVIASVLALVVSFTGPGGEFLWGFLKPLSALLFVAFFICNLLANQYSDYDQEHEYRMDLARKEKREVAPAKEENVRVGRPRFAH